MRKPMTRAQTAASIWEAAHAAIQHPGHYATNERRLFRQHPSNDTLIAWMDVCGYVWSLETGCRGLLLERLKQDAEISLRFLA